MKKTLCVIIGLAVVFAAEMASGATNSPTSRLSMPEDISQFYSDLNFAACFSTPAERSRLRLITDLDEAKNLSERLKSVGRLIRHLEAKIQKIDPGMVVRIGARDSIPPAVSKAVDVKKEGNTLSVRVHVWLLSSADNARFVSSYDESSGKPSPPDADQYRSLFKQSPRTELHTWTLVNGRWMRNEANPVLIER